MREQEQALTRQNPIDRFFRGQSYLGARLFLAGLTAGGVAGCAPASGAENKCPTTIAEVSLLVGGNPENWKAVPDVSGAWVFKSQIPQNLDSRKPGRLGVVESANTTYNRADTAIHAWYVCPESIGAPVLTPAPAR